MTCNKCFDCNGINEFNINALKINPCNGFEVDDIPKQCENPDYSGIVCRSDNKPNGCFGVNTCNQGDLHLLNNCIDCNDKDRMKKARYYRRQYISSKLPVNQPKYCDLSIIPRLNPNYKPVSEMYTYVNDKDDSSTSHTWLVVLIILLVVILIISLLVWFNRKKLSQIL